MCHQHQPHLLCLEGHQCCQLQHRGTVRQVDGQRGTLRWYRWAERDQTSRLNYLVGGQLCRQGRVEDLRWRRRGWPSTDTNATDTNSSSSFSSSSSSACASGTDTCPNDSGTDT